MSNNISEEKIEIGGVEYTLFLNRQGIVNWEKMTKLSSKAEEYKNLLNMDSEVEITDETNPFEIYSDEDLEALDKATEEMRDAMIKFYWIALYTHHKFNISQTKELFKQAEEEYGIDQLIELANQMVENANSNLIIKERKNLKALKSTKKN